MSRARTTVLADGGSHLRHVLHQEGQALSHQVVVDGCLQLRQVLLRHAACRGRIVQHAPHRRPV